jgi:hypothetical protein
LCMGSTEYEKVITMQILLIEYWKSTNHVIWELMKNGLAAFNEETGEVCFSVLARLVMKDTMKYDIQHISNKYKLVNRYRKVAHEFPSELMSRGMWDASHHHIRATDTEVMKLAAHFDNMISQVRKNRYLPYRAMSKKKDKGRYLRKAVEDRKRMEMKVYRMFVDDTREKVAIALSKVRRYINSPMPPEAVSLFQVATAPNQHDINISGDNIDIANQEMEQKYSEYPPNTNIRNQVSNAAQPSEAEAQQDNDNAGEHIDAVDDINEDNQPQSQPQSAPAPTVPPAPKTVYKKKKRRRTNAASPPRVVRDEPSRSLRPVIPMDYNLMSRVNGQLVEYIDEE